MTTDPIIQYTLAIAITAIIDLIIMNHWGDL